MQIDATTNIAFIKDNLRFSLTAEKDTSGDWFIGYNYRFNVYNGLTWTLQMAENQLLTDIERAKNLINKHVKLAILTYKKITALISIILDVGFEKLYKEDFFVAINSGNKVTIHKAFMHYAKRHRAVCAKTLGKRQKEFTLFIGDK